MCEVLVFLAWPGFSNSTSFNYLFILNLVAQNLPPSATSSSLSWSLKLCIFFFPMLTFIYLSFFFLGHHLIFILLWRPLLLYRPLPSLDLYVGGLKSPTISPRSGATRESYMRVLFYAQLQPLILPYVYPSSISHNCILFTSLFLFTKDLFYTYLH